jgi:hypothetical protein
LRITIAREDEGDCLSQPSPTADLNGERIAGEWLVAPLDFRGTGRDWRIAP